MLRLNDLLTRCILHVLWKIDRLARHRDERHEVHLVLERDMWDLEDLRKFIRNIVEFFHTESECHALIAAKGIHEDRHLRAFDILKEKGDVLLPLTL